MRKPNLNKAYRKSANNNRFEKVAILISCKIKKINWCGLTTELASFILIQLKKRIFVGCISRLSGRLRLLLKNASLDRQSSEFYSKQNPNTFLCRPLINCVHVLSVFNILRDCGTKKSNFYRN